MDTLNHQKIIIDTDPGHDDAMAGALMYDPLAAYYLINPKAFELEEMDVVVETRGEHSFGMSVAERRTGALKKPNVKVAVKIDGQKFIDDFVGSIFRLDKLLQK